MLILFGVSLFDFFKGQQVQMSVFLYAHASLIFLDIIGILAIIKVVKIVFTCSHCHLFRGIIS